MAEHLASLNYFGGAEIADSFTPDCQEPQNQPASTLAHAEPDPTQTDDFVGQVVRSRNLAEDVAAILRWNGGESLFHSVDDKIRGALAAAYPLYLHLLRDPAAWDEVMHYPPFNERQRRPKAGTEAVVAVTLAAKPRDLHERKLCSEYATALIWAELQQVPPEAFPEPVAKEGLKTAGSSPARCVRKRSRAAPQTPRSARQTEPVRSSGALGATLVQKGRRRSQNYRQQLRRRRPHRLPGAPPPIGRCRSRHRVRL